MASDAPGNVEKVENKTKTMNSAGSPFLSLDDGACDIFLIRHGDAHPDEETIVHGGLYSKDFTNIALMMLLLLVMAMTFLNANRSIVGSYDDQPLSSIGKKQAEALAAAYSHVSFGALYCSKLSRTRG